MNRIRGSREEGFTLIELLMVVLIIGILAAIAIPTYAGQKNASKNAAAQSTVRIAIDAANAYYMNNGESYVDINQAALNTLEPTIGLTAVPNTAVPHPTNADPTNVYVGAANASATGDGAGAGNPTQTALTICAVSKGTMTYCARSASGVWTFAKGTGAISATTTFGATW